MPHPFKPWMPHPFKSWVPHPHIPLCVSFPLYVFVEKFHIMNIDAPAMLVLPLSTHTFSYYYMQAMKKLTTVLYCMMFVASWSMITNYKNCNQLSRFNVPLSGGQEYVHHSLWHDHFGILQRVQLDGHRWPWRRKHYREVVFLQLWKGMTNYLPITKKQITIIILPQYSLHACFCSSRWVSLYSQKIVDFISCITQRMFRSVQV